MPNRLLRRLALAAAAPLSLVGAASAAVTGYTITTAGNDLVRFDAASPGTSTVMSLSGDATRLDAIDFRPLTGDLIGYDSATNRYFVVDPMTGATTQVSTPPNQMTQQSPVLDVDFNPTIDRMRLVTAQDDNIVFNPNDGSTTRVTDLAYAAGDLNEGSDPTIIGNGYTNSFAGATSTTQYVLDARTDTLGILANNSGIITTVGETRLTSGQRLFFSTNGGLDIFNDPVTGQDTAFASLFANGMMSLFTVDLSNGELSLVGNFNAGLGGLKGLAMADAAPVPVPAALPLFLAGLGGIAAMRRRRRRA